MEISDKKYLKVLAVVAFAALVFSSLFEQVVYNTYYWYTKVIFIGVVMALVYLTYRKFSKRTSVGNVIQITLILLPLGLLFALYVIDSLFTGDGSLGWFVMLMYVLFFSIFISLATAIYSIFKYSKTSAVVALISLVALGIDEFIFGVKLSVGEYATTVLAFMITYVGINVLMKKRKVDFIIAGTFLLTPLVYLFSNKLIELTDLVGLLGFSVRTGLEFVNSMPSAIILPSLALLYILIMVIKDSKKVVE